MNIEFQIQKNAISLQASYAARSNQKALRMEYLHKVDKLLDELKPPRSTCSTCKHLETMKYSNGDNDCENHICNKVDGNMLAYIDEPDKFGCIHHSDFEEVKHDNS